MMTMNCAHFWRCAARVLGVVGLMVCMAACGSGSSRGGGGLNGGALTLADVLPSNAQAIELEIGGIDSAKISGIKLSRSEPKADNIWKGQVIGDKVSGLPKDGWGEPDSKEYTLTGTVTFREGNEGGVIMECEGPGNLSEGKAYLEMAQVEIELIERTEESVQFRLRDASRVWLRYRGDEGTEFHDITSEVQQAVFTMRFN